MEANNLSGDQYSVNKKIGFKTLMLRSDFCEYSDSYIVVKRRIAAPGTDNVSRRKKKLTFNNALFRSCLSKTHS